MIQHSSRDSENTRTLLTRGTESYGGLMFSENQDILHIKGVFKGKAFKPSYHYQKAFFLAPVISNVVKKNACDTIKYKYVTLYLLFRYLGQGDSLSAMKEMQMAFPGNNQ